MPFRPMKPGSTVEVAMFRHVLLATDLTPTSEPAHEKAASLALIFGARMTVLHVCLPPALVASASALTSADLVGPCGDGPQAQLDRLLWRLRQKGIRSEGVLRYGMPYEHIIHLAREIGADLVVTGTHGRHGIAHAYFGSVAEKVVQWSQVPVLAVPHQARLAREDGLDEAGELTREQHPRTGEGAPRRT